MATADELYLVDIKHRRDYVRDGSGNLELESGEENLRQAIIRRVMTSQNTIVHRPNYGVGIKDYQNELNTIDNRRTLAQRIADQVEQDDRVEAVTGVSIDFEDESPDTVIVTIKVKPVGKSELSIKFRPFMGGEVVN